MGDRAGGFTVEGLVESVLSHSQSLNIYVPLLCDKFPGEVLCLCGEKGLLLGQSFQGSPWKA